MIIGPLGDMTSRREKLIGGREAAPLRPLLDVLAFGVCAGGLDQENTPGYPDQYCVASKVERDLGFVDRVLL